MGKEDYAAHMTLLSVVLFMKITDKILGRVLYYYRNGIAGTIFGEEFYCLNWVDILNLGVINTFFFEA